MTQKHIILHVGLPKTGTSAVQKTFAKTPEVFAPLGIFYPKSGQHKTSGHHNLAYELYAPDKFKQKLGSWSDLAEETCRSDLPITIISSEAFRTFMAPVVAAKLNKLFPDHKHTILLYFRPQWEYIESGYNQLARFGAARGSIVDFYKTSGRKLVDYRSILTAWQKAAPNCDIVCLPFATEAKQTGIVAHLCDHLLDIKVDQTDTLKANQKIGLGGLSAIHYCRDQFRKITRAPAANLPSFAVIEVSSLYRRQDDNYDYTFMTPGLNKLIYKESIAQNRWLAKTFPTFDSPDFLEMPKINIERSVEVVPAPSAAEKEALRDIIRRAVRLTRKQRLAERAREAEVTTASRKDGTSN
ncbi:hypothetical protein [Thalassorhabdomicrobium marinisediminis]|uniref:hypothetical protein n=1 Tax=Thalassorhabdomicrobium marinisediminis TaxID=2170577 RepID=UPI00248F542B|nr:hypothetical protein [Thalassorhabdomicrobium marinisediminis]